MFFKKNFCSYFLTYSTGHFETIPMQVLTNSANFTENFFQGAESSVTSHFSLLFHIQTSQIISKDYSDSSLFRIARAE